MLNTGFGIQLISYWISGDAPLWNASSQAVEKDPTNIFSLLLSQDCQSREYKERSFSCV